MSYFDTCFDRLIGHEGDLSTDRTDPGNWTGGAVGMGELNGTKFGISAASYPHLDIKNLTRLGARSIYLTDFWGPIGGEKLELGIAFQAFDFAANSGIGTAIRYLQRALGVADDGHWGPVSQAAIEKVTETDLIMLLLAERLELMTKLSGWQGNSRGWARRIAGNLRYAVQDT
jgi:lysozyme family protein